jgi:hypothetical protein
MAVYFPIHSEARVIKYGMPGISADAQIDFCYFDLWLRFYGKLS